MPADPPSEASSFSSQVTDSNAPLPPSTVESPATSLSDPIPWYLQVDTPMPPPPSHPLADRQLIPDLPENSPSILPGMLEYLSVDSGLDDLTLLDLRSLDPPPALGSNLLMIIGTARSVKHLNVSADRFCRWLRSNYKLRPYADGLLGRNELKLKLRRKARRAKLAASVGNKMYEKGGGADDGITTGWICVNVGQIEHGLVKRAVGEDGAVAEGGTERDETDQVVTEIVSTDERKDEAVAEADTKEEEEEYINPEGSSDDQDPNYIGFGSRSNAPRIVVQMFTEEKRAELDLEKLWQDRSDRSNRQRGSAVMGNDGAKAPMEEQSLAESHSLR